MHKGSMRIIGIFVLAFCLALLGCGKDKEGTEDSAKKSEPVSVTYTSSILDDIELEPHPKIQHPKSEIKPQDIAFTFLIVIEEAIEAFKSEEDAYQCRNFLNNISLLINILENFRKKVNLNFKRIKNSLNQLKAYNLVRQEIASTEKSGLSPKNIHKRIDIVNKQLLEINNLQDIIKTEIIKMKKL